MIFPSYSLDNKTEMPIYDDKMSEQFIKAPKRTSRTGLPVVVKSEGHFLRLDDGREILDACGGAGVTSIGHGNSEVMSAMSSEARNVTYVPWAFFDNQSTIDLQDWLVQSTEGRLTKVYLQSSGMSRLLPAASSSIQAKRSIRTIRFRSRRGSN